RRRLAGAIDVGDQVFREKVSDAIWDGRDFDRPHVLDQAGVRRLTVKGLETAGERARERERRDPGQHSGVCCAPGESLAPPPPLWATALTQVIEPKGVGRVPLLRGAGKVARRAGWGAESRYGSMQVRGDLSCNPTWVEAAGHTPSGAARHLPQQAGEGEPPRLEMCACSTRGEEIRSGHRRGRTDLIATHSRPRH